MEPAAFLSFSLLFSRTAVTSCRLFRWVHAPDSAAPRFMTHSFSCLTLIVSRLRNPHSSTSFLKKESTSMIHNGTIDRMRSRVPTLLMVCCALVVCVLAATTGAMAQATDTIQGIAPPGGLGFGIPGGAIEGGVGADTGTFKFPPAGFGTGSPDSLSD